MKKVLREIFKGETPSVKSFQKFLTSIPPEKQEWYYQFFYRVMMTEYMSQPNYIRKFLRRLIRNNRQKFLDYLKEVTILGQIQYPLKNGEFIFKIIKFIEERTPGREGTDVQLTFDFMLVFKVEDTKFINTQRQKFYTDKITIEQVLDILGFAEIKDIHVLINTRAEKNKYK